MFVIKNIFAFARLLTFSANRFYVLPLLLFAPSAFSFDIKTCLSDGLKDFSPVPIVAKSDGSFLPRDGKIWAFTTMLGAQPGHRIKHIWSRHGTHIDNISRPITQGIRFYSHKQLSPKLIGDWTVLTVNELNETLSHINFSVIERSDSLEVRVYSIEDLDCIMSKVPTRETMASPAVKADIQTQSDLSLKTSTSNSSAPPSISVPIESSVPSFEKLQWRAGAEIGKALSAGRMREKVGAGNSIDASIARRYQRGNRQGYLAVHVNYSYFDLESSTQKNSAKDLNLSLYALLNLVQGEGWEIYFGPGVGTSFWKASSVLIANQYSGSNQGADLSLNLAVGANIRIHRALSFTLNGRMKQTFGSFNERYIPITAGLTFEFGERK